MTAIKKADAILADTSATSKEIITQPKEIVKQTADIDGFITQRQAFIQKVNAICVEGKDYHIIQGKKSLAKGGAEKIASIFHWTAKFEKDNEALEMIGDIKGWIAFKCTLVNGEFVGEGRGAANLVKNGGDLNKTLKMAQKSAFIDAVLRASGLSDFYTQDLEDMPKEAISTPQGANLAPQGNSKQPSDKQKAFIKQLCVQKKITQNQLKDFAITYKGNPGGLIDFLLQYQSTSIQEPQDIPIIQQGAELSPEDQNLVDEVPF